MAGTGIKTTIKYRKITCQFEFDIRPGTTESVVELNTTKDQ